MNTNHSNSASLKAEYWDLFDAQMRFVRTIRKGEAIPANLYHITVEVIPTDLRGHLLLTQRSIDKKMGGGKFEFPAGSVLTKETPSQAALRELKEETGLKPVKLVPLQRAIKAAQSRQPGLVRITYLAVIPDLVTAEVTLQPNETISYRIVTVKQWLYEIATGTFEEERTKMYGAKLFDQITAMVGTPSIEEEDVPVPAKSQQLEKCSGLHVNHTDEGKDVEHEDWEDLLHSYQQDSLMPTYPEDDEV